ncbi:uncharacterized protein TNCV_2253841 [Trichonephila clavipes]|nr:uncharacterized protein TNCV_2253841 [Trichonephila clavipes]
MSGSIGSSINCDGLQYFDISINHNDPCGEGYAAEELRASSVTAPRNALPKAVPEDEELGCGWLGGGDSFISRNPPWLRPWTVPGSTLWGFPRCLALKNPPAVTLCTLEKCGNSWPGGGRDGTRRNPCSQNMEKKKWRQQKRIAFWFRKGFRLQRQKKKFSPSWADRVESSTPSASLHFNSSPIEEQQISTCRFFIMSKIDTFSNVSPFLIHKGITACVGDVKTIRKMRSGDLFIEVTSSKQALALASLKQLAHLDIQVKQHATLNYSRGVISAADLYNVTEEEILENMAEQNVSQVRRITIRRDGQVLKTKHLILTFATPDLPQSVKVAFLHCPVRPYIPNPLRCFQCQRFGHSKTTCRGQPTCARCAEVGHDSADCKAREKCVNCKGDHPSYSRSCPTWSIEKEITALKIKNKISYPEARRIVSSRTPVSGISYAAITKKSTKTIAIQSDEPTTTTPSSPTPGKITAKPNFITVDTSKPVSTPPNVKKPRKTRIKESGVLANKKKRSNLSKKPHDMGRMSWKSMHPKVTKVYWMICRPNLRLLAPCEEQVRRLDALLYLLELPWSKNST